MCVCVCVCVCMCVVKQKEEEEEKDHEERGGGLNEEEEDREVGEESILVKDLDDNFRSFSIMESVFSSFFISGVGGAREEKCV